MDALRAAELWILQNIFRKMREACLLGLPQSGPADGPGFLGLIEIQVVRRHGAQRAIPVDAQDARMIRPKVVDERLVNRLYDLAGLSLLQQQAAYLIDSQQTMRRSRPGL